MRRRRALVGALAMVTVGAIAGLLLSRGGTILKKKEPPTPVLALAASVEPVSGGA